MMNETPQIMVVDDTTHNLQLLEEMLTSIGYVVRVFPSGRLALASAKTAPPDVLLLDVSMPDMDGFEVCERWRSAPALVDVPIIFISALSDISDKVRAFAAGGVDYITKPFQFDEVRVRVETHLALRRYRLELREYNTELQQMVQKQVQETINAHVELAQAQVATITAVSKLAEHRDDDTGKHIERVQSYCHVLARHLWDVPVYRAQMGRDYVDSVAAASPLHDVGKVGIPDSILLKPGRLTPEEFATIKTHSGIGASTLKAAADKYPRNAFVNLGMEIAHGHHERWDGAGYPRGLAGNDISLCARIVAVADVYDALRSRRPYKEPFDHERSRSTILEGKATHFDPQVVDAFVMRETAFVDVGVQFGY